MQDGADILMVGEDTVWKRFSPDQNGNENQKRDEGKTSERPQR